MELHYGIIFTKRITGMPGTSPEPPGMPEIPWARQWTPRDAPGTPRHAPGTPGDARTPGHALGTLGDIPETPHGRPWDHRDLQGALMNHKNTHISTNRQRQRLSIAVFETAHWDQSHEALDRAVLCIKKFPKLIIGSLVPLMDVEVFTLKAQILTQAYIHMIPGVLQVYYFMPNRRKLKNWATPTLCRREGA